MKYPRFLRWVYDSRMDVTVMTYRPNRWMYRLSPRALRILMPLFRVRHGFMRWKAHKKAYFSQVYRSAKVWGLRGTIRRAFLLVKWQFHFSPDMLESGLLDPITNQPVRYQGSCPPPLDLLWWPASSGGPKPQRWWNHWKHRRCPKVQPSQTPNDRTQ